MSKHPFEIIDWNKIPKENHPGETGHSTWQVIQKEGLRIRIVEYQQGYLADHWCKKGHLVHCLEGSFETELKSGEKIILTEGMGYLVSDDLSEHRSYSPTGTRLLIVDGDFLSS